MKSTQEKKDKATVAELLQDEELPYTVRKYLRKFAAGEKLPLTEQVDYDWYHDDADLLAAMINDEHIINDPIPKPAKDLAEEFLYRLAEATGVQVYNTSEVIRVAYPIMLMLSNDGAQFALEDQAPTQAVRSGLEAICTKAELREFYERHNLWDGDVAAARERLTPKPPKEWKDKQAAIKLARVLADPTTPEDVRDKLENALLEFSGSTNVTIFHPALAERAFIVMAESMATRFKGEHAKSQTAGRKKDYKRIIALLDELE